MENNRNFLITIALSVLILTLWQVFYMNPRMEKQRQQEQIAESVEKPLPPTVGPRSGRVRKTKESGKSAKG